MVSLHGKHLELTQLLLENGADYNCKTKVDSYFIYVRLEKPHLTAAKIRKLFHS